MPKRPAQHITADRAVAAVSAVIANAGFAVETVDHDYGEDLLVQPSLNGKMDPSRIWVQVKGTAQIARHRVADDRWTYSVPVEHSRRWRRTADMVIVVLWDVKNGCGRYVDSRDLVEGGKAAVARFAPSRCFDSAAVVRLGWLARIGRYNDLMMAEKASGEFEQELHDGPPVEARKRMIALAIDLMCELGAATKGADERVRCERAMKEEITERFGTLARQKRSETREEVEAQLWTAITHALMRRCEAVTGQRGIPVVMIEPCIAALVVILGFHGDRWDAMMAA